MATFPLGARGERPIFFPCHLTWDRMRELTSIPGIERAPGGLRCTPDMAPSLATWLGLSCPSLGLETHMTDAELEAEALALPGLARYKALGLGQLLRPYQKDGAMFLARRSYAMNCDPMRSGKSLQALAASVLIDAKRTLIVAPALAKWVWAEEIAKWLKEEPLILEGRGGDIARRYCRACMARGHVPAPNQDGSGPAAMVRCEACKMRNGQSRGFKLYDVRRLEQCEFEPCKTCSGTGLVRVTTDAAAGLLFDSAAEAGAAIEAATEVRECLDCDNGRRAIGPFVCRKHPDVALPDPGSVLDCPRCIEEMHAAIDASRYVIVNYDLLVAQKAADAAGRAYYRDDLLGWGPMLAHHHFDLAIADESHLLRGWSSDQKKKGTTRREKFIQVTENIERVWALTGTPIYGYVRDLWGQLDAISKGAFSGPDSRLPFNFATRYCDGHKGEYGWVWDGRTLFADTELPERLKFVKIQRPRSEILSNLPPKIRQTIRIDDTRASKKIPRFSKDTDNTGKITRLLKSTFEVKVDAVVENVLGEMAQGARVVVFTLLRESAERLAKAIEKECAKRENRLRMSQVDAKIWCAHGDTTAQARFEMARSFREHVGAGAFVTTIDAVQVAVSLKGATSVHFAELHWQPSAMLQAEDRPYEVGTSGLTIVYYIVRGSVDEHVEQVVLPKVETLSRVVAERGALEIKDAFYGKDQNESLGQLLDSLTAHVPLGDLDPDDDTDA